jgi:hypothetical protein
MDGNTETMWHTQFSAEPQAQQGHLCPHLIPCGYHYACGYDHPGAAYPAAPGFMSLPDGIKRLSWLDIPNDNKATDKGHAPLPK